MQFFNTLFLYILLRTVLTFAFLFKCSKLLIIVHFSYEISLKKCKGEFNQMRIKYNEKDDK